MDIISHMHSLNDSSIVVIKWENAICERQYVCKHLYCDAFIDISLHYTSRISTIIALVSE